MAKTTLHKIDHISF